MGTRLAPLLVVLAMTGCSIFKKDVSPPPSPTPTPTAPASSACVPVEQERDALKVELGKAEEARQALDEQRARFNLRLLEQEAQVKSLQDRQAVLQENLDEAIREVVRAKAKLRSLESRAEAASNMAEAEIALKALKAQLGAAAGTREVAQAEQFLAMSATEYKKENYGGALYLASQAKAALRVAQVRPASGDPHEVVAGETAFAVHLPLKVLRPARLRQGPGTGFRVVATLAAGTPVTGLAQKDLWIRVQGDKGTSGWVSSNLVAGR